MPGEAETRVKHAWEGGIPRHRPPSPYTSPSPGFRGFYNRWSGKSHSTWKASGKRDSALAPSQGP